MGDDELSVLAARDEAATRCAAGGRRERIDGSC